MSKFETSALHGLKVVLFHLGSIILVGLPIYATANPQLVATFTHYLVMLGLPVALVNAVIAAFLKYPTTPTPPSV